MSNEDKVQQVQDLRRSNASGPQEDRRTRRTRDRSTRNRKAIEEGRDN